MGHSIDVARYGGALVVEVTFYHFPTGGLTLPFVFWQLFRHTVPRSDKKIKEVFLTDVLYKKASRRLPFRLLKMKPSLPGGCKEKISLSASCRRQ